MEKIKGMIYSQDALDALDEIESEVADGDGFQYEKWREYFTELPSPQPEPCEDAVSRQAAVDAITEYGSGNSVHMSVGELKRRIEALSSAQPEQRWISVKERLPEDDTEVFVYLFDRPSPYIAWVCDGCWFTEEFQVEKENYPKAWCELPEPYRGEGEK